MRNRAVAFPACRSSCTRPPLRCAGPINILWGDDELCKAPLVAKEVHATIALTTATSTHSRILLDRSCRAPRRVGSLVVVTSLIVLGQCAGHRRGRTVIALRSTSMPLESRIRAPTAGHRGAPPSSRESLHPGVWYCTVHFLETHSLTVSVDESPRSRSRRRRRPGLLG